MSAGRRIMPAVRVVPLPKLRLVQLVKRMIGGGRVGRRLLRGRRPAYRPTDYFFDGQPEASPRVSRAAALVGRERRGFGDGLQHLPE